MIYIEPVTLRWTDLAQFFALLYSFNFIIIIIIIQNSCQ